jgi:hypothetical protein
VRVERERRRMEAYFIAKSLKAGLKRQKNEEEEERAREFERREMMTGGRSAWRGMWRVWMSTIGH